MQHDENDYVVCKVNGHEEGVTQISWVNDVDAAKTLLLATSSLDGCLNMWNFSFPSSTITLKEKYAYFFDIYEILKRIHCFLCELS